MISKGCFCVLQKDEEDMKKALLLCSSHNDLGLIRALRKLGYYIIVTGNRSGLPGQKWCDEFIEADYSDKNLILSIARKKQIDAICQCCNDFGVYTASYVAEQMGLPGYDSYETTLLLHNKDKFKEYTIQHDITSPVSTSFTNINDALSHLNKSSFPVIVKPVDNSAGNGITKVDKMEDALPAINKAFEKSRVGKVVIETYVSGTQHGFCTFLINQKVVAVCSNNEYSFLNPYRVEIDTYPADNYEEVRDSLIHQIEKIASHLHLKDGIFHLQYIYDGKCPQIIEVMRRILGNMYHIPGNLLTGVDWEYWETRAKCGLSLDNFPSQVHQEGYFAYKTILASQNGIYDSFNLPDYYEKYLINQYLLHKPGYPVNNYGSDPLGFLFFMFPSNEKMRELLIDRYNEMGVIMK